MDASVVVIYILVWCGLWGGIGAAIGSGKGRTGAGLTLGIFLGVIGIIIVAVMSPSDEVQRQRDLKLARTFQSAAPVVVQQWVPETTAKPSVTAPHVNTPSRQQLMADAINRDPSLANPNDPGTLKRLNEAIDELAVEFQTRRELEELLAAQNLASNGQDLNLDFVKASDPKTDPDTLWKLIRSEDPGVALAAAANPSTPTWVLRRMQRESADVDLKRAIAASLQERPED